jgi:methyl-accepting chemotaxis protein
MAIMSRLRFAFKLGLVGLLFLAPLVALVFYQYGKFNAEIQATERERLGVQEIVPMRFFIHAMAERRALNVLAINGDKAAIEGLPALTRKVDEKINVLRDLDKKLGDVLQNKGHFSDIEKEWNALKARSGLTFSESFAAHSKIIDATYEYMKSTADSSGMSLDSDLDSFYIISPTVFKFPTVLASIGRLRALGTGILQRGAMTPDEKTDVVVLQRFFYKDFEAFRGDYAKSLGANAALAATFGPKVAEAEGPCKSFVDKEVTSLLKGEFNISPEAYMAAGTVGYDALFRLFDSAMQELDGLLVAREARLHSNVYLVFGGTAAALIAVLYLFTGMLLSVLRSLKSIQSGAERLAGGDVSQAVDSRSSDELRAVGGAVNSVTQTLQKFTKAQLDMARAHNEEGRISEQMHASQFPGAYGDMARNLNTMVKGHIDVQTRFTELMGEYAGGKFESRLPALPGERKAISDAAEKVRANLEASAKAAEFNARVKAALDYVGLPVRIADNEGIILYVNNSFKEMLRKYEAGFRRQIPSFDPEKVIGCNLSMFLSDTRSVSSYLQQITQATASRMIMGGRDVDILTTPVLGEHGERLGTAAQWTDITEQLAAEKEVGAIVAAAASGDFAKRIAEAGKSGFMLQMAQGLNQVLGTSEKALGEIARIQTALAEGDLSKTISAEYEGIFADLKGNSNATIERLREIISQIREASESINTAAREIAMGNNDLSRRTEEQASSLEETAASLEEFASSVRQNAENATQANRLAEEASEAAQRGGDVVGKVVTTMAGITESNREIADITTLIDGIAFQTNLLALNAAVEAARAGEQGRGFAVVASEVRTLAQRAAEAAKDIKAVISASVGKVDEGAKLVSSAGQAMEEIVAQVKRVSAIIGEIAAASKEQSTGIDQVNQAVTNIDQITQQNAALVEEATAAAKSLEEQSETLVQAISVFRLAEESTAAKRKPARGNATASSPNGKALH